MGDEWIFLRTRRDASFYKDLSNEPNSDRILSLDSTLTALLYSVPVPAAHCLYVRCKCMYMYTDSSTLYSCLAPHKEFL